MRVAVAHNGSAPAPSAIRLLNVSKSYREGERLHVVLDAINAEVVAGDTVALLGSSGSGKSTLLNLISGIDQPDAGAIELAGTRLTALDERARTLYRRRNLGFVYQFFNLLPTLTVAENIRLPLELNGVAAVASERRSLELLDAVGLAARATSFPERLSGGEQQRVAIARALAHAPALVLADEPTGNLDEETGEQVLGVLQKMLVEHGSTMVLATHSRKVAAIARRVWRTQNGHLIEESGISL
ncbi:MAG: ABC transporter ATP-binding protein [Chromatiales bacterium]|jgi:putative ABC transport system ATP-binding protein|nr:ABC transporter ATP-binding protein [Chromatiales bacterium]MDH4012713.1 ABC transporter ATP-binding protein [Chromatiales bacterium]PLX56515.1 MAG: ABC transporter ATP-binding protein [Chromatiales bacterium]